MLKVQLNDKVVVLNKLDKTQRNIGLLCAVSKAVSCSLYTFSLIIKLPHYVLKTYYTGHFIMFSVITNIYNKNTKGPTLLEFFTATGKLIFFFN
jgi:hypothetical protein